MDNYETFYVERLRLCDFRLSGNKIRLTVLLRYNALTFVTRYQGRGPLRCEFTSGIVKHLEVFVLIFSRFVY